MKNRSGQIDYKTKIHHDVTNILNPKSVMVTWYLYEISNIWATFEVQFIKKLSNIEAELKEGVAWNPFQPSVAFHLTYNANQMTGFYLKCKM